MPSGLVGPAPSVVASVAPQAGVSVAPEARAERRRGWGCLTSVGLAGAAFVLAVVVVAIALLRGQDVKSVDPSGKVEFYGSAGQEYSQEEIEKRQSSLERDLARLKEQAAQASTGRNVASVNLAGTWQGQDPAFQYSIQQYGSSIVIHEMTAYGITAVGHGTVSGNRVQLSYEAYNLTTGVASLELVDQRTLTGVFHNNVYGPLATTLTRL
jgi:uncharacterized small protein (DUF1192 family)